MSRRKSREEAFCLLFEQCFTNDRMEDILYAAVEARDLALDDFTRALVIGAEKYSDEIDGLISGSLQGWSIGRVSKVTLALLRLAVYEMNYTDTMASIVINEAVELAKKYGGKGDSAYLNGVLGTISKKLAAGEE